MFSEVAENAISATSETQVILTPNFTRIHCDYLLLTYRAKLLNFSMLKTATILGLGNRSRTLLNLLARFFHSPIFLKKFFHHSVLFFLFSFSLLSFSSSIYSSSTVSKRDAIVTKKNKMLLGNLRTNRERVISPSSQSKIKKKILSSSTNQHSVILPHMLLRAIIKQTN